jgi:hypothetical protein
MIYLCAMLYQNPPQDSGGAAKRVSFKEKPKTRGHNSYKSKSTGLP